MELMRCSIYPAHKVDLAEDDAHTDGLEDDLDMQIRPHYFDLPNDSKCSLKMKFLPLSKPKFKRNVSV